MVPPEQIMIVLWGIADINLFVAYYSISVCILFHAGSYTHLLRLLVSEFTLSENPANTTTSQLRVACHADDSVILGSWLQETDHRTIEDQVSTFHKHFCTSQFFASILIFVYTSLLLCPWKVVDCLHI